jgi:hypothetical protein
MLCLSNHHLTGPVFAILEWTIIIDSYIKILVVFFAGRVINEMCLQLHFVLLTSLTPTSK